jgi:hypothetical protein
VPLPAELRDRLVAQAQLRKLKLATTARVLLDERLRELEDAAALSDAEEWQRREAWRTWQKIEGRDLRDVPIHRFDDHTQAALSRARASRARR